MHQDLRENKSKAPLCKRKQKQNIGLSFRWAGLLLEDQCESWGCHSWSGHPLSIQVGLRCNAAVNYMMFGSAFFHPVVLGQSDYSTAQSCRKGRKCGSGLWYLLLLQLNITSSYLHLYGVFYSHVILTKFFCEIEKTHIFSFYKRKESETHTKYESKYFGS